MNPQSEMGLGHGSLGERFWLGQVMVCQTWCLTWITRTQLAAISMTYTTKFRYCCQAIIEVLF